MIKARVDERSWLRCGNCSHKLMRLSGEEDCGKSFVIEVKCHSCKAINTWWTDYQNIDDIGSNSSMQGVNTNKVSAYSDI